jgi:hypothetical protein
MGVFGFVKGEGRPDAAGLIPGCAPIDFMLSEAPGSGASCGGGNVRTSKALADGILFSPFDPQRRESAPRLVASFPRRIDFQQFAFVFGIGCSFAKSR